MANLTDKADKPEQGEDIAVRIERCKQYANKGGLNFASVFRLSPTLSPALGDLILAADAVNKAGDDPEGKIDAALGKIDAALEGVSVTGRLKVMMVGALVQAVEKECPGKAGSGRVM